MTIKLTREEIKTAIEAHLSDKGINVPLNAEVVFYQNEGHGEIVPVEIDHAEVYLK